MAATGIKNPVTQEFIDGGVFEMTGKPECCEEGRLKANNVLMMACELSMDLSVNEDGAICVMTSVRLSNDMMPIEDTRTFPAPTMDPQECCNAALGDDGQTILDVELVKGCMSREGNF